MTETAPLREDIIEAVFRPVIAFFVGLVFGYTAQMAESTGWPFAIGFTAILGLLAVVSIWLYWRFHKVSDWILEKLGIAPRVKPQLAAPPKRRKHWFVRYGWIAGLVLGFVAATLFPEEIMQWL